MNKISRYANTDDFNKDNRYEYHFINIIISQPTSEAELRDLQSISQAQTTIIPQIGNYHGDVKVKDEKKGNIDLKGGFF